MTTITTELSTLLLKQMMLFKPTHGKQLIQIGLKIVKVKKFIQHTLKFQLIQKENKLQVLSYKNQQSIITLNYNLQ